MKFFFSLINQYTTLFLAMNNVTTLHFNNRIEDCVVGANDTDYKLQYDRNKRSVSLHPTIKTLNTNMKCYIENGDIYLFNLKVTKSKQHKDILVERSNLVRGGTLIVSTSKYELYENPKNYYIVNKSKGKLIVNELEIKGSSPISKWSPIIINGSEVWP